MPATVRCNNRECPLVQGRTAGSDRKNLRDVAMHKLIVHPRHGATRRLVDKVMANHGAKPRSIIEVANCRLASTFAETNAGVAIVHSLCIAHEASAKTSSINLERLFGRVPFGAVFRKAHRHPLVDAMLDELLSGPT
ncbi:MAG TPA: LysR substrate-binding domain-containing protein [Xanthobacteraceae bacterium]|jgi:DNA-binding transcriptional LysR family regulator|nr:LysR substrate-binding domain-containing protein [Xanthobacteraceae bacterium]